MHCVGSSTPPTIQTTDLQPPERPASPAPPSYCRGGVRAPAPGPGSSPRCLQRTHPDRGENPGSRSQIKIGLGPGSAEVRPRLWPPTVPLIRSTAPVPAGPPALTSGTAVLRTHLRCVVQGPTTLVIRPCTAARPSHLLCGAVPPEEAPIHRGPRIGEFKLRGFPREGWSPEGAFPCAALLCPRRARLAAAPSPQHRTRASRRNHPIR
ncbi:hypothetical protein NDU88_006690 [Pleurodeles waltl]|uniref:Uncharacterized protein n=1 Tax=Pleurodeles waltl TaxID=8319 RepID=A0AAV7M0U4_PLEWA|nr:hypothetical protein NDU88_006690 [Pleurodeles waltl]